MAVELLTNANRHHNTLMRGIGDVWMSASLTGKDSDDAAYETKTFDLHLGCLNGNWMASMEPQVEDIMRSCGTGNMTIHTGKTYTVTVNTRDIDPWGIAAIMGHKIKYDAISGKTILVQEKFTSTVPATPFTVDLSGETTIGTYDSLYKIVSVYKKSSGQYLSEAAAAVAGVSYTLSGNSITFAAGDEAAEMVIVLQFYSDMETGDVVAFEDGVTFANTVDIVLSWLRKIEEGPNAGKKGYLVGVFKNAMPTSTIEIGGDAQSIIDQDLEFSINFQDEGDIELHWKALE